MKYYLWGTLLLLSWTFFGWVRCAVVPPPWADPKVNPCALMPRGWQMLFWPSDGKCYKIFQLGHPCPPTMELTPGKFGSGVSAECHCPPGSIRTRDSNVCHPIFTKGPCNAGEYFAPDNHKPGITSRLGSCKRSEVCPDPTQIFWPTDGKCYRKFSKGPCPSGKLISPSVEGFAVCHCDKGGKHASSDDDTKCYEHYSTGPCSRGQLFLPGGRCGCTPDLPHYHSDTKACYEIGSIGPCNGGHRFALSMEHPKTARCSCKKNYELWSDGTCYRLYTHGPCPSDKMFAPPSRCVPLPCQRSRLYFPEERRCHKIGTQGPCRWDQVVIFDFEARPSLDGIAYNGVCGCSGALALDSLGSCSDAPQRDDPCQSSPGMVDVEGICYMLYTKGPCREGEWLLPTHSSASKNAECFCKPGFTKSEGNGGGKRTGKEDTVVCLPPTVTIARYLNEKYSSSGKGR